MVCSSRTAISLVVLTGFLALLFSQSLMYIDGMETNQKLVDLESRLAVLDSDLQTCNKLVSETTTNLQQASANLDRSKRELSDTRQQINAKDSSLSAEQNQINILQEEIKSLKEQLEEAAKDHKVKMRELGAECNTERDRLHKENQEIKDDVASFKEAAQRERDGLMARLLHCPELGNISMVLPSVNYDFSKVATDPAVAKRLKEEIAPSYGVMNIDQCRAKTQAFTNLNNWIELVKPKPKTSKLKPENVCILQVDHRAPFDYNSMQQVNKSRLFDWEDAENTPYQTMSFWVNYMWAARFGVPFNVYVDKTWVWGFRQLQRPERSVQWRKVPGMLQHLQKNPDCAFVVYLDSDVYMRKNVQDLLDLIEEKMLNDPSKPLFLLSEDQKNKDVPEETGKLNTGVIILRNDPETYAILKEWYYVPEKHEDRLKDKNEWPFDQASFNNVIAEKYTKRIAVVPLTTLNSPKGDISRHLWGGMSSAEVTGWLRLGMFGNVIKGMIGEIIQPCVEAVTIVPDENISIDFLHGKWPRDE